MNFKITAADGGSTIESAMVQIGDLAYKLPATAIDTAGIMEQLGATDPADVKFDVEISASAPNATQSAVASALAKEGSTLVIPAMEFTVRASYGGKTIEVDKFSEYVSRTIEITKEQAEKLTTAVVVEPDGTLRHVPTKIVEKDGKYFVEINSLTDSTYAVVFNEKKFTDLAGKWYEKEVQEMADRLIIKGMTETTFDGDANVTRAQFAAIVVRALGLPANGNTSAFTDVYSDDWYFGVVGTAYEYGIVSGRTATIFDPKSNITWQEAMIMINNAATIANYKLTESSCTSYPDAANVSEWAIKPVELYIGSGLFIHGGKLRATELITRSETAVAVLTLLQKAGLVDVNSLS